MVSISQGYFRSSAALLVFSLNEGIALSVVTFLGCELEECEESTFRLECSHVMLSHVVGMGPGVRI